MCKFCRRTGFAVLLWGAWFPLAAQPEFGALDRAYAALRAKGYEEAVYAFREAAAAAPRRADIHKDLAYTLLKIGQAEDAREEFRKAMELTPADDSVAMEFAFLAYEAKDDQSENKALARRIFERVQATGNETAAAAFQNIDRPLAAGIERWTKALEIGPETFSAHYELAQLCEQRDLRAEAAAHYLRAWQLLPARKSVLLDLARMWTALQQSGQATSALLACSRGGEPRAAERARELLPKRYPYVYEFREALKLDPNNVELHRELAYLLLAMKEPVAQQEFQEIVDTHPEDLLATLQLGFLRLANHDRAGATPLLKRVANADNLELAARARTVMEPNLMAEKSLKAGFLEDALRYLNIAHESDPSDYDVVLKLGWTYNMLHQDRKAIQWFDLARQSPDSAVSSEASRAYRNLKPDLELFRTTAWVLPFYSSRWKDFFGYGQLKTELNIGMKWVRPYVSLRLVADTKPANGSQALSERSFIGAVGLASQWRHFTGWAEAGSALNYTSGSAKPDYRGGVSWARGWTGERKFFLEANADEVFISRFGNDWLSYLQSRFGYRWLVMNANLTADSSRQHWANFVEGGPGFRFHAPRTPKNLLFSVNYMRGLYLVGDGIPAHKTFTDIRAGFWYAITK